MSDGFVRPLPPVRTPLKLPPLAVTCTSVRTVTGIVFVGPPTVESTIAWAESPEAAGLVAVNVAVAVLPAAIVSDDGEIVPAGWYSQVVACHWMLPVVPTPPEVAPSCSVKKTAVQVPAAGSATSTWP